MLVESGRGSTSRLAAALFVVALVLPALAGAQDGGVPDAATPDGAVAPEVIPPPPSDVPPPDEAVPPPAEPAPPALRLVVVDAAVYSVDPVVGRHVSAQMRETGAAMGYEVLAAADTVAAAQGLRMPYPPAPADLWRLTFSSQSQRGAFARVWAERGSYVIEVTVASLDGAGPFFARGSAGADDLRAVVDRLLREALPTPDTFDATASEAATATPEPAEPAPVVTPPADEERPRARRRRRVRTRRIHLVLQSELVIGTSQDSFINVLFGGRIDYRISKEILMGLYLGYANLRGKDGRASNILVMGQIENRVRISSSSDITVPLRLGLGYLPFNGPVIRLAGGLNIPLSRELQLGFDILAPTFWVLPDRTAVSLDVAAELIWRP